jgi:hypothetical protein
MTSSFSFNTRSISGDRFQAGACLPGHQVVEDNAVFLVVSHNAAPRQKRAHLVLQPAHAVIVGGQKDQAVLPEARLIATLFQDFRRMLHRPALTALAEGRVRRQHHQPQRPVVGHIAARREDMDAAEQAAGK